MEETLEFCVRVLGAGQAATVAAEQALVYVVRSAGVKPGVDALRLDRIELLTAASRMCRTAEPVEVAAGDVIELVAGEAPLADAVAVELAVASAALPERQREALALRETFRLSYDQIGSVMGIGVTAVAPLLARARLRLRSERRGPMPDVPDCADRDRSLRLIAYTHDSEPLSVEDHEWLAEHIFACESCDQAQAAMLEASVCYRAWNVTDNQVRVLRGPEPVEVPAVVEEPAEHPAVVWPAHPTLEPEAAPEPASVVAEPEPEPVGEVWVPEPEPAPEPEPEPEPAGEDRASLPWFDPWKIAPKPEPEPDAVPPPVAAGAAPPPEFAAPPPIFAGPPSASTAPPSAAAAPAHVAAVADTVAAPASDGGPKQGWLRRLRTALAEDARGDERS